MSVVAVTFHWSADLSERHSGADPASCRFCFPPADETDGRGDQ